ncbi:2-oxoglutarate and iron-dependent oxygenase domain-containing protein [Hydrogenophaga sp.]|uniref:isopenicillin N synthase family dioxygenase n=1 Tax=Hydrogenophaga sp. TaxID=1904254 RepID=UPI0026084C6B|nr:2-oxoglutarate and iron-dependent oxygenase domain-containing protein [Hydrogenophaga sp.]MCW5653588.1 isopenicillin N synthase family oxygenase [Hydrogenophaga sp.]
MIPVIDISSALAQGSPSGVTVSGLIGQACRSAGFFYVTGHGVPREVVEQQFDAARQFFDLPLPAKTSLAMTRTHAMRGYESMGSQTLDAQAQPDQKESFQCGIDYPDTHDYVRKRYAAYGKNQWPEELPGFRTQCERYFGAMQTLSARLMQLIALSLGLRETYFDALNQHPSATLRLLRYPPQPPNVGERTFGAGAHTDWGAITVLAQDDLGGLEVQMPDGTWVAAPPLPDSFVVNLGDMIPRWTGGLYRSNFHRVRNINSQGRPRYSIPFFSDLDYETVIHLLPGMPGNAHGANFTPCTIAEHMTAMYERTYRSARA